MTAPPRAVLLEAARLLLGELGGPSPAPAMPPPRFESLTRPERAARVGAVDGGQTVVTDLGTCGIAAWRAGFTLRSAPDRHEDRVTQNAAHTLLRREADAQWRDHVAPYTWGLDLAPPATKGPQWVRGWCEQARGVAEYDAARRVLRLLRAGDLLLWDGSLDVDLPQAPFAGPLVEAARREGVTVVGVTKDTTLTLQGTLPFTVELEEGARMAGAPATFAVDVTEPLGRAGSFRTYGVRLDARAPVYRIDVAGEDDHDREALRQLLAHADDVAYPGYPYPLARVHGFVHYRDEEALELRRQLEALVAERRGSAYSLRLFGRGRDVLALGA